MPCQKETFGRVFIPTKDENTNGDASFSKYEVVRSACFSNLDLKWYNLGGELHPLFKDYSERSISLGFTIKNTNKSGALEDFKGKFLLPLKLGEIASPDLDYLDELNQFELDCAKKFHIISNQSDDSRTQLLRATQTSAMFLLMTPGKKLMRSNFLPFLSLLVMFDDIVDNHTTEVAEIAHGMSYKQLVHLSSSSFSIFKDGKVLPKHNKMELLNSVGLSNIKLQNILEINDLYDSFQQLNQQIYDESLKYGNHSDAEPFFLSLLESYEALTLQHCREWKRMNSSITKDAQIELCKITISTKMAGEAIALMRGIKLSSEIRSSFLFKWFLHEAITHAGKVNDFISFNKEMMTEDDCNNEVYILHVLNDWPLEKALQKVLDNANESLSGLNETAKLLLEIYENDKNLEDYIRVVKEVICGHIQWFAYITRYHSTLVYDCYIETAQ